MEENKTVHFGNFIYWKRVGLGKSIAEFAQMVGLSEKRVWEIEKLREPVSYGANMGALAIAIGIKPEDFESIWRATPVPPKPARESSVKPDLSAFRSAIPKGMTLQEVLDEAFAAWQAVQKRTGTAGSILPKPDVSQGKPIRDAAKPKDENRGKRKK